MAQMLSNQDLLTRLVSFDTTSVYPNRPLADFICEYIERPGVRIERDEDEAGEKVNLLILAGPEPDEGRLGLLLSGHMDVVPATEPQWETDPWVLTEKGGALFGRGSCDMKGFDAIAINAFLAMDQGNLTRPLGLLLTCDEETGTLGAQRFGRNWPPDRPLPRNVLIGEPTSLRAVRMHKGHLGMRIDVFGRSAHSGSPHLGVNAIEPAAQAVTALAALQESVKGDAFDTRSFFPDVPYTVLSVTTIDGGSAVNIVPERCTLHLSIRLLPGQASGPVVQQVRDTVATALPGSSFDIQVTNESPPLLLDNSAPINRTLCDLIGQTDSYGVTYASDGGPFQDQLDMDCILYGPGTIDVAHKPNESVPIDEFNKAAEVVARLIDRECAQ